MIAGMRAGQFVAAGTMECVEVPVRAPGEGELLVRTAYASICGSDLHSIFPSAPPARLPGPPGFPGHEGVGEVVESRAPEFATGDRVLTVPNYMNGMCFAEIQTIPAAYCIPLPPGAQLDHVLMAQQLGTVIFALKKLRMEVEGRDVAIVGQGSAGAFFAFLLRRAGASTIAVSDLSDARLQLSKSLGVDVTVNASEGDFVAAVREATGGKGAELVVEAVGSGPTLAQSLDLAARDAEVVWFGLPDGPAPVPFSFSTFFGKRLTAWSVFGAQDEPGHTSFREALDLIASGEIDVSPLLSHVLPIEEIGRAFHLAHTRDDGALKVSLSF